MLNFFASKKLVGLDIGSSSIKLAEIEKKGKSFVLTKFDVQELDGSAVNSGEIIDAASVTNSMSALISRTKTSRNQVATALWGTTVVIKKMPMPRTDAKAIPDVVRFQAEQYIPFSIDEVCLEYKVIEANRSDESMDILLIAAKQEYVATYMATISAIGPKFKASCIDVSTCALANCFEFNYGVVPGTVALLNVGSGTSNFAVLESGEIIFGRDLSVGGMNFTSEISKSMGISLGEAESMKLSASRGQEVPAEVNSIIATTLENVVEEMRGIFDLYSATSGGSKISSLYISGGTAQLPGFMESLSRSVGIPYQAMDPMLKLTMGKAVNQESVNLSRQSSAVVVGLALREAGDA